MSSNGERHQAEWHEMPRNKMAWEVLKAKEDENKGDQCTNLHQEESQTHRAGCAAGMQELAQVFSHASNYR